MNPPFQAAKWLKIQALIDEKELSQLMDSLAPFSIYPLSGAFPRDAFPLKKELYVAKYHSLLEIVKRGEIPTDFGALNASMWTRSESSVWLQEFPNQRYVARAKEPFLQVQVHHMSYSSIDREFRPMSLSQDRIFWGLQFSFPQIFEHPEKGIIETSDFENGILFHSVRKWSRQCTIATPMWVDGRRKNLPIRLGKNCFSWIHCHAGLAEKNLSVLEISEHS